MASLFPKRTIANPATAAEIATTKRSTAIGYSLLSTTIGGLGLVKGVSLLSKAYKARPVTLYRGVHKIPTDNTLSKAKDIVKIHKVDAKLRNYATSPYGNWFTSSKETAKWYSKQRGTGGSVLKVKVPHKTLMKIKTVQPPISKPVTALNKQSREFFGVVPSWIRRKAKKI